MKEELTPEELEKFFEKNKLGSILMPNDANNLGNTYTTGWNITLRDSKIKLNMNELYKEATKWCIKSQKIKTKDIIAIIVYGSSVRYPDAGYTEETKTRRKFVFFGEKINEKMKIPKKVEDIDVLVITKQDISDEKYIKPIYNEYIERS